MLKPIFTYRSNLASLDEENEVGVKRACKVMNRQYFVNGESNFLARCSKEGKREIIYSTVTLLARFLGWST